MQLACSWHLPAGCDAIIEASFYGTRGGAVFRNVDGSLRALTCERTTGPARETVAPPSDDWPDRAAIDWADRLAHGERFDPACARLVQVQSVLDRIYDAA